MLFLWYLGVTLLCYALYRLITFSVYQYALYQQMKNLPGPPIDNPFLGHLKLFWKITANGGGSLSKELYQQMATLCDTFGREHGFIRLWLGPFIPVLIVCDPLLAKKVLSSPHHIDKASFYQCVKISAFGDLLVTMSGEDSAQKRKPINEHFTLSYLDRYAAQIESHLQKLVAKIDECIDKKDGRYDQVNVLVSTLISDTLEENLFSTQSSALVTGIEPAHSHATNQLFAALDICLLQPWRYFTRNSPLTWILHLVNHQLFTWTIPVVPCLIQMHSYINGIIWDRYEQLKERFSSGQRGLGDKLSMLDSLLLSHKLDSNPITRLLAFYKIARYAIMFILAGHDTSTTSISWLLYHLAWNAKVQQKAQTEVDQFLQSLAQSKATPNQMNLKRLHYLEDCFNETMRLYPVAKFIGRYGTRPLVVNDQHTLPANTDIWVFFDYTQRHEQYFANPNDFIPERFESAETKKATFPFSCGERFCLGKRYAIMQMKLFLIRLLSKYKLTPLEPIHDHQKENLMIRKPTSFGIKFVKRN